MHKPTLIRFIEDQFGKKPPAELSCRLHDAERNFSKPENGSSIVIIGGGIAGPAFAKQALSLALQSGIGIHITLVSRPSCNYCGGLVTNLSLQTMHQLYGYEPAPDVILTQIDEVVLVTPQSSCSVKFASPLASVFRTSRFGQAGLDDNFRQSILAGLPEAAGDMLTVLEPAVATAIDLPSGENRGAVTIMRSGGTERIDADLIVLATGLRSLESKLLASFRERSGYCPPEVMPACVTEIDLSVGGGSCLDRRMLILNGVVKDSVVALIPKQSNWITVAGLKRVLSLADLRRIFDMPSVREFVQVGDLESSLACSKICRSGVFTAPARNFYGEGWVVLGDLTGCGRVLKDGYFAALLGAQLAAHTAMTCGWSRRAFDEHYRKGLKRFRRDNIMGMKLFDVNNYLAGFGCYNRIIAGALSAENNRQSYGGLTHAAFRALSTGELPYSLIGLLFFSGLGSWALRHPLSAALLHDEPPRGL